MTVDSAEESKVACVDECPLLAVILKQLLSRAKNKDRATLIAAIEDNSPRGWKLPEADDEPFQVDGTETDFIEIGCTCPVLDTKVSELLPKIESIALCDAITQEFEE
ncbi:MAG: hypothetical protein ACFFCO_02115 [Promethearchaeota archaeon]